MPNETNTNTELTSLNYAKTYQEKLAQLWPEKLYFGALYSSENNGKFRWNGGNTVCIPHITVGGRVDANRDTIAAASRNYDNDWEVKTLRNCRKWSTLVHPLDIDQTNYAANIENITAVYNREQKFPEMDAYCVSKLYQEWTALKKKALTTDLTVSNILRIFDTLMKQMTEARVPLDGRILYVTPAVMGLIRCASGVVRGFDTRAEGGSLNRTVTMLDGVEVVMVPEALMKTAYDFTEGWQAAGSAKQIQMLLVHPGAVVAPVTYRFARLDPPNAVTEGKYLYFEESAEDVFLIGSKAEAVAFVLGSAVDTSVPAEGIALSAGTLNLTQGGAASTLTVTFTPENASDQRVRWMSTDSTKASVSDTGVVTPAAAGTAQIIASSVDGGYTAVCTVTVSES